MVQAIKKLQELSRKKEETEITSLEAVEDKKIGYVDGGSSVILNSSELCYSFIRIFGCIFFGKKRIKEEIHEFYVLTNLTGKHRYESKIFGETLIDAELLKGDLRHPSLRQGNSQGELTQISSIARRYAELIIAKKLEEETELVVLDGTIEAKYVEEINLLKKLKKTIGLSKTHSLPTLKVKQKRWMYKEDEKVYFVNLGGDHIFRIDGEEKYIPQLIEQSTDPVFLGYPYGLIYADQRARISNQEKELIKIEHLAKIKNLPEFENLLNTKNAHEILDKIQY